MSGRSAIAYAESSLRGWYKAAKSANWQNILEVHLAFKVLPIQ
ncbi:type II toxin-antitoxin system HigB family toxin [Nostoc sp. BAE]|nr:type II toxin-antitoxin system HigB family toxin [Nostoc commune BAE]